MSLLEVKTIIYLSTTAALALAPIGFMWLFIQTNDVVSRCILLTFAVTSIYLSFRLGKYTVETWKRIEQGKLREKKHSEFQKTKRVEARQKLADTKLTTRIVDGVSKVLKSL